MRGKGEKLPPREEKKNRTVLLAPSGLNRKEFHFLCNALWGKMINDIPPLGTELRKGR